MDNQEATSTPKAPEESLRPPTTLRSGMEVPSSPLRDMLQFNTTQANEYYSWELNESARDDANALFDKIGTVPTISIAERRSVDQDLRYRCAEYVFNTRQGENWDLDTRQESGKVFWKDNYKFLLDHDYKVVDIPEAGDVIGYGYIDESAPRKKADFKHFGIYEGGNEVVSKFDAGHIFRHPWNEVPSNYGPDIYFFRKSPPAGPEIK